MRIFKSTKEGSLIGRLFQKNTKLPLRSRHLTEALNQKWKLVGSTDDKRADKIPPPALKIDWTDLGSCFRVLRRMKSSQWNKVKRHCVIHGLKLDRRAEGTRERIKNVSAVMDFAFNCGWTGELDALDESGLKKVLKKVTKPKQEETKNVSKRSTSKDSGEQSNGRGEAGTGDKAQ